MKRKAARRCLPLFPPRNCYSPWSPLVPQQGSWTGYWEWRFVSVIYFPPLFLAPWSSPAGGSLSQAQPSSLEHVVIRMLASSSSSLPLRLEVTQVAKCRGGGEAGVGFLCAWKDYSAISWLSLKVRKAIFFDWKSQKRRGACRCRVFSHCQELHRCHSVLIPMAGTSQFRGRILDKRVQNWLPRSEPQHETGSQLECFRSCSMGCSDINSGVSSSWFFLRRRNIRLIKSRRNHLHYRGFCSKIKHILAVIRILIYSFSTAFARTLQMGGSTTLPLGSHGGFVKSSFLSRRQLGHDSDTSVNHQWLANESKC